MALIPIFHTPKPRLRRKRLGAGDVIQVSQHIHNIVQQALTFNKRVNILHVRNVQKYCLTTIKSKDKDKVFKS